MCLCPITIRNNAKRISLKGGTPFSIQVPCGKCSECKQLQQDEYYFRSYYQAVDTLEHNGYVYFDTLTYSNDNLPHISDFEPLLKGSLLDYPCFNLDHYRKFFVRLRRAMSYRGYDPKCLKYFLCSEYGSDNTKTHRPHYHILFYCTDPKLDVLTLSDLVAKNWPYGRTDGRPYKGDMYVKSHCFDSRGDKNYMRNLCHYVAKYVTKNSRFDAAIESRIKTILIKKGLEGDEAKEYRSMLRRHMCEFHRQSQGFGVYGLKLNDLDRMFATGMMEMKDSKNVVKHIPMPMYFQRKLFYDLTVDFRGNKVWQLNDYGIDYKLSRMDANIERTALKFKTWYDSIPLSLTDNDIIDDIYGDRKLSVREARLLRECTKERVDHYLNGRSWKQFAEYLLVYKGRVKTEDMLERENNKIFRADDKIEFLEKTLAKVTDDTPTLFNYNTPKDRKDWYRGFLAPTYTEGYSQLWWIENCTDIIGTNAFIEQFCIDERSDERFKDFDKIYKLYVDNQYSKSKRKNNSFDKKEELKQIYAKVY